LGSYVVLIKTLAPTLDDAGAFQAPDPPHGLVGRQFSL
jgi:hypothetical protein